MVDIRRLLVGTVMSLFAFNDEGLQQSDVIVSASFLKKQFYARGHYEIE